ATSEPTGVLQDDVALCMYDESEPGRARLYRAVAPGDATCRKRRKGMGCRRGGKALSVVLQSGRKHTTVVATAAGSGVAMPAMPLPLPVRVQLQTSRGTCW